MPLPAEEGAERYEAYVHFGERHQGGPGIVHGGIVAAALDEAAGLLATWYRFPTVTARIFVRYRHPVPINTELLARAWVESARGRRIHVEAELLEDDEVLAEARAAFLHVPLDHFLATPRRGERRGASAGAERGSSHYALAVRARDGGGQAEADEDPARDPALK